jgi:hypothetical protein
MMIWGLGALLLLVLLMVGVGVAVFGTMKGSRTVTWVLAGLLLLVLAAGVAVLLRKPSALDLEVVGPPGTPFVGEVTVDGTTQTIRGTAPMTFFYPGRRIEYVIIPETNPDKTELEIRANGTRFKSFYGARGELAREGPMMFREMVGGMAEPDWDAAANRLLPEGPSSTEPPPSDPPSPTPQAR